MPQKVILFELNEVPWRVLEDFVQERPTSALARVLPRARAYETHADDTALSPWITWPTVHRGVSDERHTISDFGQDLSEINAEYPAVWELLSRRGVPTGVCGSLHTYPLPERVHEYAFYIPDVFAAGSECFPPRMESFQAFNLEMSRASARNVSAAVPWKRALRFAAAAPGLGLTLRTMADVGRHVSGERRKPWRRARRRTYQVVLAFDIFMRQLARTQPVFSTFFTNHVASSMHRYWAARYPGDYEEFNYPHEWVDTYRGEIAWTMSKFDDMLRRLVRFVERTRGYTLWIATSMGQAATEASAVQTQLYLHDVGTFMQQLGVRPDEWESRPAMLPRVVVALKNGSAPDFARALDTVRISDRGPLPWKRLAHDVFRIHPGALQNVRAERCSVEGRDLPLAALGFRNVEIEDSAGQSAYHVPQGALLIYDPARHAVSGQRRAISTTEIAPMLLAALDVPLPAYMRPARA